MEMYKWKMEKMETHDKKWAIQQMLDGWIVLNEEWDAKFRYHTGKFQCFFEDASRWVNIEINGIVSDKYRLCAKPKKVELPEPKIYDAFTKSPENDFLEDDYQDRLANEVYENREYIKEIIKYLKAKENN